MAGQTRANKGTVKKLGSFFRGVKAEIKKVNWPNKSELTNHTLIVLVSCLLMSALIWLLDTGLHSLFSLVIG